MGELVLYVLGSSVGAVRADGSDTKKGCCMQGRVLYSGESRLQEIHAGSPGYGDCVCTGWLRMCGGGCACAQGICERRCTEEGREAGNQQVLWVEGVRKSQNPR